MNQSSINYGQDDYLRSWDRRAARRSRVGFARRNTFEQRMNEQVMHTTEELATDTRYVK